MITIINPQADTISGSLGITMARRNQLVDEFMIQEDAWRAADDEGSTRDLFNRIFALAKTEAEQCYICCMYGRFIEKEYGGTCAPLLSQIIFKERS